MNRRHAVLVGLALVAGLAWGLPAEASVLVETDGTCVDGTVTAQRLHEVMSRYEDEEGKEPRAIVKLMSKAGAVEIALTAFVERGATLERRYTLATEDCVGAGELILVVVERFLSGVPFRLRTSAAPAASAERGEQLSTALGLGLSVTDGGPLPELTLRGETFLPISAGARLGAELLLRGAYPERFLGGRVAQGQAMLGALVGLRASASLELRAGLRGGIALARGVAMKSARGGVAPWLEVPAMLLWQGALGQVGVELDAAVTRVRTTLEDGALVREVPWLRVGLVYMRAFGA